MFVSLVTLRVPFSPFACSYVVTPIVISKCLQLRTHLSNKYGQTANVPMFCRISDLGRQAMIWLSIWWDEPSALFYLPSGSASSVRSTLGCKELLPGVGFGSITFHFNSGSCGNPLGVGIGISTVVIHWGSLNWECAHCFRLLIFSRGNLDGAGKGYIQMKVPFTDH